MPVKRTAGKKSANGMLVQIRRDLPFIVVATFVVIILGSVIISARTWGVFGSLPTRMHTSDKVVALTFDDGPTQPETSRLLKILSDEQIKATFYLIGLEMNRASGATDDIIAAGHEIGNHGYTHKSMIFMSWSTLLSEIQKTDRLIRSHGYNGPITIRPPFGHKLIELPLYAMAHNRSIVMWDLVLGNKPNTTVDTILKDTRQVRPGSIIIMHTMYAHNKVTLESVGPLVKQLKSEGYRFVTVSELLDIASPK